VSIKKTEEDKHGKLKLSNKTDMDKIEELLATADEKNWSVKTLHERRWE